MIIFSFSYFFMYNNYMKDGFNENTTKQSGKKLECGEKNIFSDLKNIIKPEEILYKYNGINRKIALEKFKKIYVERVEGIGELRKFILEILKKDKDLRNEEIFKLVKEFLQIYHIPLELVKNELEIFLNNYQERRKNIDNMDYYEIKVLNEKNVILGDDTKIEKDIFDIKVWNDIWVKKFGSRTKKWVLMKDGGFSYEDNPISYIADNSDNIKKHEEQHNIYELMYSENKFENKNKFEKALNIAKDELLAFFRDGSDSEKIRDLLLIDKKNKNDAYSYIWRKLTEKEKEKYDNFITKGYLALEKLYKEFILEGSNIDREKIIGFLQHIKLEDWENYVDKYIKRKKAIGK